jgi:hypothetical protein
MEKLRLADSSVQPEFLNLLSFVEVYKKILIVTVLSGLLLKSIAQIGFDSSSLQDIYYRLAETEKRAILDLGNKNQNSIIDTLVNRDGKFLSVLINNGKLQKLGIEVKNLHLLNNYDSIVKTFIERVLLRLSCDSTIPDIVNTAEISQIRFLFQEKNLLFTSISSFKELFDFINSSERFKLSKNGYLFVAEWNKSDESLKMIFPNNYQLLVGKNKKELDEELLKKLDEIISDNSIQGERTVAETSNDSLPIIILKGSSYMDHLSSDTFYKWNGTDSILVFEKNLTPFSISNLFLIKKLTGNRKLELNQKLYGGRSFKYSIYLKNFINYFENDFQSFVGLENNDPDLIEGTVIFSHKYFNFVHLLHFKTTSSEIFNDNGNLTANFYTNIPMNNVSDVFMKYVPGENEQKIDLIIKNP